MSYPSYEELKKETNYEPTKKDLESLTELDASYQGIKTLDGLERAVNLEYLDLDNNTINNLKPLENLTKLTSLYLKDNDEDTPDKDNKHEKSVVSGKKISVTANDQVHIENTKTVISMPADLPEGTTMTVERLKENKLSYLNDMILAGEAITVTMDFPENAKDYHGKFLLTMPYDHTAYNSEQVDIYYFNEETNKWEKQNGHVDAKEGVITIEVPHFSTYAC